MKTDTKSVEGEWSNISESLQRSGRVRVSLRAEIAINFSDITPVLGDCIWLSCNSISALF